MDFQVKTDQIATNVFEQARQQGLRDAIFAQSSDVPLYDPLLKDEQQRLAYEAMLEQALKLPRVQVEHGSSVGALALQEANAEIARLTRLLAESAEMIALLTAAVTGLPPADERSKGEQISDALRFDRPLDSYGRND